MERKEILKAIIEDLNRRKRSIDALRLLLEDDDPVTALAMSERLRSEIDGVVVRLRNVLGETAVREGEAAPLPAAPPMAKPAPGPRGYLGDDEAAGGFEKWVDRAVDGFWHLATHPGLVLRQVVARKNLLIFLLALGLAISSGWNAYQKAYLADHGLVGEYYLDENFSTLFTKRPDASINFRWLRRPPMAGYRSEHFSVRWTGYVKTTTEGLHEFYTISDDGVRVWIDDQLLIENWGIHGGTLDKGQISLKPGYHRVRVEYFQGEGDSVIKLQWKRPGDSEKRTIPARFLFPRLPEG